jgi:hypothetical protein
MSDSHPRLPRPSGATTVNEPTKDQPPSGRISPAVLALLRESLTRWAGGDGSDDSTLRDALHAIAREARDKGIPAEEVLVTLKTTWFDLVGPPTMPHTTASGQRRLDQLVTACIKAYYG